MCTSSGDEDSNVVATSCTTFAQCSLDLQGASHLFVSSELKFVGRNSHERRMSTSSLDEYDSGINDTEPVLGRREAQSSQSRQVMTDERDDRVGGIDDFQYERESG